MFRGLDANGDWQFGKGKQSYVTGQEEIALNLRTRILCIFRDCFFDILDGIDWFNLIGYYGKINEIKEAVRARIASTDGIVAINSVEVLIDDRRNLQLRYDLATIFSTNYIGTIEVEELFNA